MNKKFERILILSCTIVLISTLNYSQNISFGDDFLEDSSFSESKIFECNCIAFRLDDVQDYWLSQASIELIETFKERELPFTIGVLANNFGEDEELTNLVQVLAKDSQYKLEIASHGTVHDDFTTMSNQEQKTRIAESIVNLETVTGITPKVFIPPFGAFNEGTITALKENGITHFSPSFITGNDSIIPIKEDNFYQLPSGAITGEESNFYSNFVGLSSDETFSLIEDDLDKYGYSIVTMHPQEFSAEINGKLENEINVSQFDELEKLLDNLQSSQYPIVNIQDITEINSSNETQKPIPEWVRNIFIWYGEEKIGEQELKDALQFLIREKILVV